MFGRFFGNDPFKQMDRRLAELSPDSATWRQVGAYLGRGRRPGDATARAVIRAYLDLREHLGALASFKNGAELNHQALGEPCRRFFATYRHPHQMSAERLMAWACFCLAADHLLALAYEAAMEKGAIRKVKQAELERRFAEIKADYLDHLERAGRESRPVAEPVGGAAAWAA